MTPRVVVADVGNFALKAGFYRWDGTRWTAEGDPLVVDLPAGHEPASTDPASTDPANAPPAGGDPTDTRPTDTWQRGLARWYQTQGEALSLDRLGMLGWRVASVNPPPTAWLEAWVSGRDQPARRQLWRAISAVDVPLQLAVRHPERVGIDRLVAAWAAWRGRAQADRPAAGEAWHFPPDPSPPRPVMVVDAGSAMTVDLVAADGTFLGGAILPGRQMQLKSLGVGAFALPDLSHPRSSTESDPATPAGAPVPALDLAAECPGQDTVAAIELGVAAGMLGAIRQLREAYTARLAAPPELVVTGGDAARLAPLLGATATWVPHLVLDGLAQLAGAPPDASSVRPADR